MALGGEIYLSGFRLCAGFDIWQSSACLDHLLPSTQVHRNSPEPSAAPAGALKSSLSARSLCFSSPEIGLGGWCLNPTDVAKLEEQWRNYDRSWTNRAEGESSAQSERRQENKQMRKKEMENAILLNQASRGRDNKRQ